MRVWVLQLGALAVIFARVTPSSCACQSHHGPLCGFALHRVPHKVFAHKSPGFFHIQSSTSQLDLTSKSSAQVRADLEELRADKARVEDEMHKELKVSRLLASFGTQCCRLKLSSVGCNSFRPLQLVSLSVGIRFFWLGLVFSGYNSVLPVATLFIRYHDFLVARCPALR